MDVKNLYTNIPMEKGIECIERAFQKYLDQHV